MKHAEAIESLQSRLNESRETELDSEKQIQIMEVEISAIRELIKKRALRKAALLAAIEVLRDQG